MTRPRVRFGTALLLIVLLGATLRFIFPTADPPWRTTVGVVWHDEGAWTHNARNLALFGTWRTDNWNPMFIAPVFTGLEYLSFASFGVGLWQARLVSQVAGTVAVLLIGLGVRRVAGDAAGLMAAAFTALNYVGIMYDRAAIMESTMVAFIVVSWWAFARAQDVPRWGFVAGVVAVLAFFTKAAAAFHVGAIGLTAVIALGPWFVARLIRRTSLGPAGPAEAGQCVPAKAGPKACATAASPATAGSSTTAAGPGTAVSPGTAASPATAASSPTDARSTTDARSATDARHPSASQRHGDAQRATDARHAAVWTLVGLAVAGIAALAIYVGPFWQEYRFYNWQMSVTRKPSYDVKAIVDRISWLPILHDLLTRMWPVTLIAGLVWLTRLFRWRSLSPPEWLLLLWVGLGVAELLVHDVGNERRFVFLIPALAALAGIALGRDRVLVPATIAETPRTRAMLALPLVLYVMYVLWGTIVRTAFLYDVGPAVRLSAALATVTTLLVYLTWPRIPRWLAQPWSLPAASLLALLIAAGGLVQFVQFAAGRSYKHVEASRALGRILPPGTLVHGKLANGLALENRIHPVFVGRGFGNYEDRLKRDDVPFILTYVVPRIGYEGPVIRDVVDAYPHRRVLWTFDVAETPGGTDRAALMEKGPPAAPGIAHLPVSDRVAAGF